MIFFLPIFFLKKDNFCDFLAASLGDEALSKRVYSYKKESVLLWGTISFLNEFIPSVRVWSINGRVDSC